MTRVQTAVGLCVPAAVWWALPRLHTVGRPGQPRVPGSWPQRTGTPLGEPQGESLLESVPSMKGKNNCICCVKFIKVRHTGGILCNAEPFWDSHLIDRTEKTWRMRKCRVLCGTTTSSTSSKRSEDKNFSSGFCSFFLSQTLFHLVTKLKILFTVWLLTALRFLKLPLEIKKHQLDAESPERTPPQEGDFPDSSHTHDFSEDLFEVSPDRASPLPPPTGAAVG